MYLRQINAAWGDLGRMLWPSDVVVMGKISGKCVDCRSSLSTCPSLHFLLVFFGPWTGQNMGLSFPLCQEKDLDWSTSEISLTLISGEFVRLFEAHRHLLNHLQISARKKKMSRLMSYVGEQT